MLPRFLSILLVIGIQTILVVGQEFAPPEILAAKDPDTILQPPLGRIAKDEADEAVDNPRVIRGLLFIRQESCSFNYAACTDGGCCPVTGACCGGRKCCSSGRWCYGNGCCRVGDNGCEGNSCCTSRQTCCKGGGCCSPGWYCDVVNGVRGCCRNGKTCGTDSDNVVCTTAGYVPCTGLNFCCPLDYQCFRDAAGNPQCRLTTGTGTLTTSGNGVSSTPRPTNTSVGSISSGVTSKISFNLFSIAPLLGWIAYVF